ncbi:MAG: AGE family epimerase/isomerase [Eubacteriales bacterium]|nr:AGE family epimerase/isomerase [Eubacteriales bacterium]MDD3880708.1 AGE family epimerase/isomerase [Eubacteriales bacterium]MDD4511658.1 AGE family epimerase/isomerase [Eubacteriales bacterium]
MLKEMAKKHLTEKLIPFWEGLRDDRFGGFTGYVSYSLERNEKADKGCILNSRILWFFSNAYTLLKDESLLENAKHAYAFLQKCLDDEFGGIFWSMSYDGKPSDVTKHTYNQAFCIYALSSYYEASGDKRALSQAKSLWRLIEEKCRDEEGYLEAFRRDFSPEKNDKLSENGVEAGRTMNTLLHVFEAYTELYRVSGDSEVKECLYFIFDLFENKIYNPEKRRQEVFFDMDYNTLIDLHSYGHDIETSWLMDRGCDILGDAELTERIHRITDALAREVYERAWHQHSLYAECERGRDDKTRVWWVQAETVLGFINMFKKHPTETMYRDAAEQTFSFIMDKQVDKRDNSEWFWALDDSLEPIEGRPIVEPWKCPYHNGRMCMELIKRL